MIDGKGNYEKTSEVIFCYFRLLMRIKHGKTAMTMMKILMMVKLKRKRNPKNLKILM